MAGKSSFAQRATLNALVGGGAYVALYKNNPGEDNTGDEVQSYARIKAEFNAPVKEKGLMICANTNQISFPAKTEGYGTITHVGLFDAQTAGNLLYYAQLQRDIKSVDGSRPVVFAVGELKVVEA